jgi:hypothetical protein
MGHARGEGRDQGEKGGRPFIVCIQWRDSRCRMVFDSLGIRLEIAARTEPRAADQSRFAGIYFATEDRAEIFCRTQDRGLMPARVSGFNCSHALPFNIDKRTRGGRQALRASGGCVPGRGIPAQQAGELRDGEHRAGPAAGVRGQRGTGSLPGAEKHWFARCEARLTLHGVDRLDSGVLRYSQGSYLSGDG